MQCVRIACITAILLPVTFAQFDVKNSHRLSISFSNSSNDLATALNKLNVEFNISAVTKLELYEVYVKNREDFSRNDFLKRFSSSSLTDLHIENGKIEDFPENTFEKWKNSKYKHLDLINIGLKSMSKGLLEPINKLSTLNASHNELTHLPKDVFKKVPSLFILDLSHNKLDNLSKEIFEPVEKISDLYLNNNNITSLNTDIFSSMTELEILNLSFNNIQYIHHEVFGQKKHSSELRMSQAISPNTSAYSPRNLFVNLSKLWHLNLDQNNIEELPEDIFGGLVNLRLLNLSNNRIHFLAPKTFQRNVHLNSLDLANNKLESLNNSLFNNLEKLEYLNLSNNYLTFLHSTEVFATLIRLRNIKFDNNEKLQLAYSTSTELESILYKCENIEYISARNTNVSKIYSDWFSLRSLRDLDLRNTPVITSRLNYTFQSKRVSLRLTSSSKESVIIHKYDKLELNADASSRIILDENQQCGDNCSCVFSHWYSERLIKLQCTRFNGIKLQPKIPERIRMLSQTSRVEFHLQQCNIMDLEVLQIADYLRQIPVRKLSLSNNRLSSVQQLADSLTNLEVLELDNNKLRSLDEYFVGKLSESKTLKTIQLHGNPWNCHCSAKYFSDFVAKYSEDKIPKSNEVLCGNGEQVKLYDSQKDCDVTQYAIVYILSIVALAAVGCSIILALYYRYELNVKIWMYHHHEYYFPRWFFPVDESFDRWKSYDVFVSYAEADQEFVKKRLRPKLEDEDPKLKLCLHYRDWNIGDFVNDQIYKSVANSRRTLIVLSHNFLNSDLCKLEFQVARDQAIKDKVGRVIVIMLEDIATHRLSDELKAYITKYTYIPWQDNDWFWRSLRYALHDKVKIHVNSMNTDVEIPSRSK